MLDLYFLHKSVVNDVNEITKLVVTFKLHVYEKIQQEVKKILIN